MGPINSDDSKERFVPTMSCERCMAGASEMLGFFGSRLKKTTIRPGQLEYDLLKYSNVFFLFCHTMRAILIPVMG